MNNALEDLVVVEPPARRRDPRIVVSLPGRYWLASKRDARGGLRQFACRVVNISPHAIGLAAPVQTWEGDRAAVETEHFGRLQGNVVHLLGERGFLMRIAATDRERRNIAAKIVWLEKFKNLEVADQRADARFAPKNPASILVLADGSCIPCFIIDLSTTGAAVSADVVPDVGTPLALGRIVGRVVRHFTGGFAIHFLAKQDPADVEDLATRN